MSEILLQTSKLTIIKHLKITSFSLLIINKPVRLKIYNSFIEEKSPILKYKYQFKFMRENKHYATPI